MGKTNSIDMDRLEKLEKEIELIKERNASVEIDKKWETSWMRRGLIAVFTYLAISIYMWAVSIDRPFLNAIVPTVGFMLSTLTLPWFKRMWINRK
jgi:hypothetical protein